jgi:hypothetical protein
VRLSADVRNVPARLLRDRTGRLDERLERNGRIRKPRAIDARSGGDEGSSLHVIRRDIEAIDGHDPARLEVDERKALRRRFTSQDDVIVPDREADRLQAQIVLVRPEPGHTAARRRRAAEMPRNHGRLIERVLHGLDSHASAIRERGLM